MTSYRLSQDASNDVLEIWLYIAKDSTSAADRLVRQLPETFQQLADGIVAGERVLDPLNREARRISQGNYAIYHRRVGRVTEILRVIHGARLLEDLDE
jgi:plasmid stabilization system protein ParE